MTDAELRYLEKKEEFWELLDRLFGDPYARVIDPLDDSNLEKKIEALKKAVENGSIRDTPEMFEAFGIDLAGDI